MRQTLSCLLVIFLWAGMAWAQTTQPASEASRAPATAPATQPAQLRAAVIPIVGPINDYTFIKFKDRVEQAERDGVDTVIIKLNTPGGAVGPTFEITRLLKGDMSKRFRTVAYIDEMAYSAGTMIAVACNEIVMSPNSVLGDVAPILPSSDGLADITGANRAKIESPIVAEFEDSAERNGYDPTLLRAFVQYQLVVYVLENDAGETRFASGKEYEQLLEQGWHLADHVKNPIDDELTLLTVNNTTAEKLGLSKGTFDTIESFADSRGVTVAHVYDPTFGEGVIDLLSHDMVRGGASLIFMLSIYMTIQKPGSGIFETMLVISGTLLLGVPLLTGYASWIEIVLILLGVALLALEVFIIPGFGVAGVAGIFMILCGLVLTFVPSEAPALPDSSGPTVLPQLPQTQDAIKQGLVIVASVMVLSLFLWYWLSRFLPRMPYLNRLVLQTTVGSTIEPSIDPAAEAVAQSWPAVGTKGTVVTDLRPGGLVRFYDSIINDERNIDVISDHGFVPAGSEVVVRKKQGTEIVVRKT